MIFGCASTTTKPWYKVSKKYTENHEKQYKFGKNIWEKIG